MHRAALDRADHATPTEATPLSRETMTPGAFSLVLAASLGWAAFDALRKRLVRDLDPTWLLLLLTAVQVPLFAAWGAAGASGFAGTGAGGPGFTAAGAGPGDLRLPDVHYWWPALSSVALNVAAGFAFLHALARAPLSAIVPLLSLTPVFTTLLSIPLLGERPTAAQAVGVALVVGGALALHPGLLARSRGRAAPAAHGAPGRAWTEHVPPARAERAFPAMATPSEAGFHPRARSELRAPARALPGVALGGLTALLWSTTTPLDKLAVERGGAPLHGVVLNGGVALGVLLVRLATRALRAASSIPRAVSSARSGWRDFRGRRNIKRVPPDGRKNSNEGMHSTKRGDSLL